mmetsp:Transcript_17369/g.56850  ORF Transcript_17369/g.56850 Transcript_17369/m.56850 type:complete len:225 (+) Transcript_17369:17-691(+)
MLRQACGEALRLVTRRAAVASSQTGTRAASEVAWGRSSAAAAAAAATRPARAGPTLIAGAGVMRNPVLGGMVAALGTAALRKVAFCEEAAANPTPDAPKKSAGKEEDEMVDKIVAMAWPHLEKAGFGGALGVAAGFATKQLGRSALLVAGVLFLTLQGLSHLGYVDVKWMKLKSDLERAADANGDGKFSAEDLKAYLKRLFSLLSSNIPGAAGFLPGFLIGLRL